jgi:hypothetical protein
MNWDAIVDLSFSSISQGVATPDLIRHFICNGTFASFMNRTESGGIVNLTIISLIPPSQVG